MKKAENSIVAVLILMLMANIALPMANAQNESTSPTNNEVNITGPHAVFYNVSGLTPLENRQRLILQGIKTSTGCQYPNIMLKITNDEGNIAKVIRELAVNPDTCQQLVEQGTFNKPPENPNPLPVNKIISQNSAPLSSQGTKQAKLMTNWYAPNSPGFYHWWNTDTHWYDVSYSTHS